jgi:hypothetical protein
VLAPKGKDEQKVRRILDQLSGRANRCKFITFTHSQDQSFEIPTERLKPSSFSPCNGMDCNTFHCIDC